MVNRGSASSPSRIWPVRVLFGLVTLTILCAFGVWELFRGNAHYFHVLSVLIALFLSGLAVLFGEFASSQTALSESRRAHERFLVSMVAGHSAAWDLNVSTGQMAWFGDLQTLFGIPSNTFSSEVDALYRHAHPEDRQRVSEMMTHARENHSPFTIEFRSAHEDGTIRLISANGKFQYDKKGNALRMLGTAVDVTDRKQAEEALAAMLNSAMDAIITVDEEQRIVMFNTAAERMFQCAANEALGTHINRFIPAPVTAKHETVPKTLVEQFAQANAMHQGSGRFGELYALRSDGETFPAEASISQSDSNGKKWFTLILRDITERLDAERALRESEERFRLVANTAPVMIWMSGTDMLCNYFNRTWLEFTGRPLETELGNGWAEGVHVQDADKCLQTYTEAFGRRKTFEMQYRLRRRDGEYRWVIDIGVPRFNPDGSFAGYIGSCIDITEQKQAEEAMASVGRRLIEAHEEERTRIGRELHDDVNQRLALLAVELDRSVQKLPSSPELRELAAQAQQRIHEIAKDIQSLSHRLHSSRLDYLGLAAAANSLCKELSEKGDVNIKFTHTGIPRTLPKEVSLCLFRVLQEALQNALKHSGVTDFRVDLRGTARAVQLTVTDTGVGFEEQEAATRQGLGLISMRERLQLVHGELSIESHRGAGTTIRARVLLDRDALQSMVG